MSPNEHDREVLTQMIILKDRMQRVYRLLSDIVEKPDRWPAADNGMKQQVQLGVNLFELSVNIAHAARRLGYGVAAISSETISGAIASAELAPR